MLTTRIMAHPAFGYGTVPCRSGRSDGSRAWSAASGQLAHVVDLVGWLYVERIEGDVNGGTACPQRRRQFGGRRLAMQQVHPLVTDLQLRCARPRHIHTGREEHDSLARRLLSLHDR